MIKVYPCKDQYIELSKVVIEWNIKLVNIK